MSSLQVVGELSYTVNTEGDVYDIRVGSALLDELIDDNLEPTGVDQDEYKDILHFGAVRLTVERITIG
jgi:hypothetical protein